MVKLYLLHVPVNSLKTHASARIVCSPCQDATKAAERRRWEGVVQSSYDVASASHSLLHFSMDRP
jgi:hypothetical protein